MRNHFKTTAISVCKVNPNDPHDSYRMTKRKPAEKPATPVSKPGMVAIKLWGMHLLEVTEKEFEVHCKGFKKVN